MSIKDFSYESLANKGLITGQANYYVVLQYRMKVLVSGDKGKYAFSLFKAIKKA